MTNFYQGEVKVERGATKTTEDREQAKFHFESGIACDKNKLSQLHILIVDDQIPCVFRKISAKIDVLDLAWIIENYIDNCDTLLV